MTAEIAIINKNAVVLAADSAVTLRDPNTSKIYNTANKLFIEVRAGWYHGVSAPRDSRLFHGRRLSRCTAVRAGNSFAKLGQYAEDFFSFDVRAMFYYPVFPHINHVTNNDEPVPFR